MWKKLYNILNDTDAVVLTSAHNLRYFTGFRGGEGIAVIGKSFRRLFVDSRYTVEAKEDAPGFEVVEYSAGKLLTLISAFLSDNNVRSLGFEDTEMSVALYERWNESLSGIEFIGLNNKLDELRAVKTEQEIDLMREAEHIGDIAFKEILPYIKAGVSERDISAELEYRMRRAGADGTSFDTIVVSGIKSAMPHGKPDGKKLESGDLVTMDFGCIYQGYCSDMTRTVAVETISDEKKKIYDTVLKAQLAGLSAIRAGIKACDADVVARKVIEEAGYGDCFGHSLGHGVGLLIHELPNLSPRSEVVLCENSVVTCEPGIYVEGLGGVRIEDMVVVKNGGVENLTYSPKELIICG